MARNFDVQYVSFYTEGSAARKIAPVFPKQSADTQAQPKRQRRKVIHVDPVAIFSIAVAALMLIFMSVGLTELQNARLEAEQMQAYVRQLEEQNTQIKKEYYDSIDLVQIEKTALALGMVPQDQVQNIQISVPAEPVAPQPTVLESILAFLTNLFA